MDVEKLPEQAQVLRRQQNFGGIVSEKTDSSDSKIAKNREEPRRVQSLAATINSGMPGALQFGVRARPEETVSSDQTGEDSDPEVEKARQDFLKAKWKKTRAKTVDKDLQVDSSHQALGELPMAVNQVCHFFLTIFVCKLHSQTSSLFFKLSTRLQSLNHSQLEMLLKTDRRPLNPTPTSMESPNSGVVHCENNHGNIETRIDNSFNRWL